MYRRKRRADTPSCHPPCAFLLGDGACCLSTVTGFGLSAGLISAYIIADELCENRKYPQLALKKYEEILQPHIEDEENDVSSRTISTGLLKPRWRAAV
ncbi:hypothetical protein VUR80DRAFT_4611 [Thermomyces stellatus]